MTADREAAIREALDGGVPLLHREDRMARRQKAEDALDSLLAELAAAREQIEWHKATKRALMDAHEAAVRREAKLREALTFYDDHKAQDGSYDGGLFGAWEQT